MNSSNQVINETLSSFLKDHKCLSGKETHTSMKGGKYTILEEELDDFYELYSKALNGDTTLSLTERHPEDHCIPLIDMDFRIPNDYDLDKYYDSVKNPLIYTKIDRVNFRNYKLLEIISIFSKILNEDYSIPESLLSCYVFMRPSPYPYKDQYVKDGIHMMFPDFSLKYDTLYDLRLRAMDRLKDTLNELGIPFLNKIDDILDEAVIEKNNWLMYGSTKPNVPAYQLIFVTKYNKEYGVSTIDCQYKTNVELVKHLSIQNRKPLMDIVSQTGVNTNGRGKKRTNSSEFPTEKSVYPSDKKSQKTMVCKAPATITENDIDEDTSNAIEKLMVFLRFKFPQWNMNIKKIKRSVMNMDGCDLPHYMYFITTDDKYCMFIEGEHKRSTPTQYVQVSSRGYYVKCFNQECHDKHYPKMPEPIPQDILVRMFPYLSSKPNHHYEDPTIIGSMIGSGKSVSNHREHKEPYTIEEPSTSSIGSSIVNSSPIKSTIPMNTANMSIVNPGDYIDSSPIFPANEATNVIQNIVSSMRVNFPQNELKLDPGVTHQRITDENGNYHYIVPFADRFCPISKEENDDVRISGQISTKGFNIRSYHGKTYGMVFPPNPIPIDKKYLNCLFVNNLTVNNVNHNITNIYQTIDDELIEFEEDKDSIKVFGEQEYLNLLILKSMNSTHYDIGKLVFELNKDHYRCVNPDRLSWYQWKNHHWALGCENLTIFLSEKLVHYYQIARKLYQNDNLNKQEQDNKRKKIEELIKKLKTSNFKSAVITEAASIFYAKYTNFIHQLDENPNLIAFENGVYHLDKFEFMEGMPEDCVSFTTKINYNQYVMGANPQLELFLCQILPNVEIREYVLKFVASCLCGSNPDEKFYIWTGSGGNGKSKFVELIDKTFGEYSFKLPISLLTQKRQASNQASPELAGTRGKRFGTFQEPSENERINVGLMKELTGGDRITCRGLFKDQMEFKPQFKLVLCCNSLPEIPSQDGGTWRRLRVVEFTSKFVDNPDPNNPNEFKADHELNTKLMDWKEDFGGLLIEYYKKYKKEGLKEPEEVMKYTSDYKKSCDSFKEWLDENYILTNEDRDTIEASLIYQKYKDEFGDDIKIKTFGTLMTKYKVGKKQMKIDGVNCRVYYGIKMKDSE